MSANQLEARRGTATYELEGISWVQVRESNGGARPEQLTAWKKIHGSNQSQARTGAATHSLEGVSQIRVSQ